MPWNPPAWPPPGTTEWPLRRSWVPQAQAVGEGDAELGIHIPTPSLPKQLLGDLPHLLRAGVAEFSRVVVLP